MTTHQEQAFNILRGRIKNKEKYSLFYGYAGVGKTFVLGQLLQYLPRKVRFIAYTGAAAQQMKNRGLPAQTIHSLIKKPIVRNGECIGFSPAPREELEGIELIVVDEVSMLGEELLRDLAAYDIPLLLVGDPFQLQPVGEQANLLLNTKPHAFLEEVVRQALDSPIVWAATEVREGREVPFGVYGEQDQQLLVAPRGTADESWYRRKDVQFICGLNNTRHEINHKVAQTHFIEPEHRIIFLRNDFKMGVVNGTMAEVVQLIPRGNYYLLSAILENGERVKNYPVILEHEKIHKRLYKVIKNQITLAYAVSCHKAQGRSIDKPMVIIDESGYFREERKNWQYVALTRATNKNVVWLK